MVQYLQNEITYLLPGEMIVTSRALKISTILGSCVSVCLYDEEKRIAGINHYLLPLNKNNDPHQFRYGDSSLDYMLRHMIKKGAQQNRITARIFGGSLMFSSIGSVLNIGMQNVVVAKEFLSANSIPVLSIETGGKIGRKVIFDTSAGVITSTLLKN